MEVLILVIFAPKHGGFWFSERHKTGFETKTEVCQIQHEQKQGDLTFWNMIF